CRRERGCDNDRNPVANERGRHSGEPVVMTVDAFVLQDNVPPLLEAPFGEAFAERDEQVGVCPFGVENADHRHRLLLRPGGRRGKEGGEPENQLAAAHHQAVQPPSASSDEPVTSAAAGEARKTTACATSATVPTWPSGMRSRIHWRVAGSSKNGRVSGVSIKVGAIDTTRTPLGASSTAIALVSPSTACLVIT